MDLTDAALVSRLSAQGGAVFRPVRPAFPDGRAGRAGIAGHAARRRRNPGFLPTRQSVRERRRQYHARGADRGDIKNLITSMDDAIDQMQQTAKAVILFEVRTFEPPMREMGTLLVECANLVGRALPLMKSIGDIVAMLTAITEEVTKLEGRVDDLHDIGLKELFLKHRNASSMDFIVGAEIYKHLEKVADRFDDVANEINSIVIEQV